MNYRVKLFYGLLKVGLRLIGYEFRTSITQGKHLSIFAVRKLESDYQRGFHV